MAGKMIKTEAEKVSKKFFSNLLKWFNKMLTIRLIACKILYQYSKVTDYDENGGKNLGNTA